MKLKIAICDDDLALQHLIHSYLLKIEKDVTFEYYFFSNGEDLIEAFDQTIDLVLLDIQMEGINGIETAKILRKKNNSFDLFLITSNIEYAIEGYEVKAYAFLQKPVQYASFARYIDEIIKKRTNSFPATLHLKENNMTYIIPMKEIIYIEVYGHHTDIITHQQTYHLSIPLNTIEKKLNSQFFRTHKSYLINLLEINKIKNTEITMNNQALIPLSKYRKKDFLEAFSKVIGDIL